MKKIFGIILIVFFIMCASQKNYDRGYRYLPPETHSQHIDKITRHYDTIQAHRDLKHQRRNQEIVGDIMTYVIIWFIIKLSSN